MATAGGGQGKNKVVAGVLGILLGFLGIHHFYLGSTMAGVICILLNVVCLGGLMGLVEGIMLLVMSDADFDAKYNQRTPEPMEFVFTNMPSK
jgi:TM2 domain-containing membrane protein YozV